MATITHVQYKGYTIMQDPNWSGYSDFERLLFFPTEAGIQHDYDGDSEGYRYCGNCKWVSSIDEAKEIIDEL